MRMCDPTFILLLYIRKRHQLIECLKSIELLNSKTFLGDKYTVQYVTVLKELKTKLQVANYVTGSVGLSSVFQSFDQKQMEKLKLYLRWNRKS